MIFILFFTVIAALIYYKNSTRVVISVFFFNFIKLYVYDFTRARVIPYVN